ncbi:MAG: aromatic ring-hydroxylating dioxygenase subunit alpha [Pseudomonadota bacterium]
MHRLVLEEAMEILQEIITAAAEPLASARSLPFAAYTDRAVFAAEAERIFAREWVFVCMEGELPSIGDYLAITIANEPVIVLKARDGELRALSNICRHRGTVLLNEGFGTVDQYITCPYHAWAYDTLGALQAVPYNQVISVDRSDHQLTAFQVESWNGLVFVNLDPNAAPLDERLEGIDPFLSHFEPQRFDQASSGEIEVWQSNWKLVMENAMESYHLFKVHKSTLELVSPTRDAYYIAGSSEWSLTGGATARAQSASNSAGKAADRERSGHYVLVQLAPSFVGVLTPGSFGWLSAHPVDEETTRVRSGATYLGDHAPAQDDPFTRAFFAEDQAMCERVQQGMRSQRSKGGKLVDMEQVIVDFHQFLASRLGGTPPSPYFEDENAALWRPES